MPVNENITRALALIVTDPSKILGLTIGSHLITPGDFVSKADAQSTPTLSFTPTSPASNHYLVICLDTDGPFPSLPILSPILHWIQAGLQPTPSSTDPNINTLTSREPHAVRYAGPGPPPGSGPHRYVFLLYEQPEGFEAKNHVIEGEKKELWKRIRFDFDAWVKAVGLGDVLAVTYFRSN